MALDPLKFKIAIERRELDSELKKAKDTIKRELTDVPITIKIANLDAIKKQLESLEVKVSASGTSSQKESLESLSNAVKEAAKLLEIQNKVQDALAKMNSLASGAKLVEGFAEAKKQLEAFKDKLATVSGAEGIKAVAKEWADLGVTINKVSKDQERENKNNADLAKKYADSLNNAKKVLADIDNLLKRLYASQSKAGGLGINTDAIQKQIAALKEFQAKVREIKEGKVQVAGFKATPDGDLGAAMRYAKEELRQLDKEITKTENDNKRAAKEAERNAAAMAKAAQSANALSAEEQKLAQAIQQSINQMNHQSQVLTDLKSMAMQYLSVYAGQQFLNNIIEIGGQLEMQRLSIGAILQDTAHANDLFDKIKGLALQSPFGVVELDQFTKQLSAYGFKYNELFDMTKRLADISAGAGTDVSRLALALGHVRAEGALTGYTLRQFAMNNIPMLGELSKKLSELEGHTITAGDVRKRVRNKEIDYAMVESVIKDLTNEGGMFYNMQEVISGSVKAKWKNLRDAFDIMYGEMAESAVGGGLKDVATTLTTMAKRWKELGTVVMSVATVYGGMKAVMLVYNTLLGQQARATFSTIAAQRQSEISNLRYARSYRTLTIEEQANLMTGKKWARETMVLRASQAISTGQLKAEEIARSVALGKMTKAEAQAAIMGSKLDMVTKSQMVAVVNNVRTYRMFTGVINGTAMAFARLSTAMRAILMNPMTWVFAAVAVITDLWQRNNQEMERAKELGKALAERSAEGIKNTKTMMGETEMKRGANGAITYKPASEMSGDAMLQTMEKWTTYIKEYSALANTYLQDAMMKDGKLRDIPDQYERLAEAVRKVAMEQEALAKIAERTESILGATDTGWFWGALNDDLVTNMNDYAKSVKKTDTAISKYSMSHKDAMKVVLDAAKADKEFADAIKAANAEMQEREQRNLTEEEQLKKLISTRNEAGGAMYESAIGNAMSASYRMGSGEYRPFMDMASTGADAIVDESRMLADMDKAAAMIKQYTQEVFGKNINDLADHEKAALLRMVTDITVKAGDATEATRKRILQFFTDKLEIKMDMNDVEIAQRMSLLEQDLRKLTKNEEEGGWVIDLRTVTNFSDLITKMRQEYKAAQDYFKNVEPLMMQVGIKVQGGMKALTPDQMNKAKQQWMTLHPGGNAETFGMALDQLNNFATGFNNALDFFNLTGISPTDSNPGGKVLKTPKPKKDKTSKGSKEDKQAKEWKERIRLLRDARSWYDKWEKEIGHSAALEKVQEMFKGLVTKKDVENLEAYRKSLQAVINMAQARKSKNKGKDEHADEVIRQGQDVIQEIDLMIFQREGEKFTSGMKKEIDDLTRRWEIYNSVLEDTGDRMTAMRLAGFTSSDTAFGTRSAANSLRNTIDAALILPNFTNAVDYNAVSRMSDTDIDNYVKQMFSQYPKYQNMIEGIADGLKEWKRLQQSIVKEDINNYAKLIGAAKDYATQIRKNNSHVKEEEKRLNDLFESGAISREARAAAMRILEADRDWKNYQTTEGYRSALNRAGALTEGDIADTVKEILRLLEERRATGAIDDEEYNQEADKARNILREWNRNSLFGKTNALTSYLSGGNDGLRKFLESKRDLFDASGEWDERDKYEKYIEMLNKAEDTLDDFNVILSLVTGTLDGLHRAATALSTMFDALGHSGSANTWSDIADGIGAVSSIFTPISNIVQTAKNGDVGGLISSTIAAPFEMLASPITGFAQLHDKRRERLIEEIKEEVQKIDNTLNLIRAGREKTLGYDSGEYRRRMADMYSTPTYKNIFAQLTKKLSFDPMYEYYTRGGIEGSGYSQELAALQKQREDYMKMYEAEEGKKKSSSAALEEYKQKMAELDAQIEGYTMELAKELWSIDLKGWADQIGDALMNAFENGTSAAQAFRDATRSILQSVVSEMLKLTIIEPMMKKLEEKIKAAVNVDDPKSSMGAVLTILKDFFSPNGEGHNFLVGASEFLSGAEELFNQNGLSLKNSSQSSQTSGIQSQATEETIGVLSGQMARIAQDVSVKRIFVTQIATEQMPKILENAQMQRTLLESQFQSVKAIEHMMADGDGALYASIDRMSRKIDRAISPEGRLRVE